ncbi:MAG TPA: histidine phosphatase family protein, partial [Devosia sp.]|nr:histidine phosphatase family protein [Devosia sp.]
GGESLKDTAARTLPYYESTIVPQLKAGKTVLVVAHGNSLRSIVMAVEALTPEQILKRELATGEPVVYRIGADGKLEGRVEL